jgi:hypothetical protein
MEKSGKLQQVPLRCRGMLKLRTKVASFREKSPGKTSTLVVNLRDNRPEEPTSFKSMDRKTLTSRRPSRSGASLVISTAIMRRFAAQCQAHSCALVVNIHIESTVMVTVVSTL